VGKAALIAISLVASATYAHAQQRAPDAAQAFPSRPVRLIVANSAGSAPDIVGRLVGGKIADSWGQPVVIDNRPGATGLIAADVLANAPADGYTLFLATMTQLISTLQAQRHFLATDFAAVGRVATTPFVIVVDAALPVKTLAEWIAYAKARPGQLLYGLDGQWGSTHLCMESLNAMAGIRVQHVPYKGTGVVMQDIAGGRIQAYCPAAPSLPAIVQTGKVRALAVTYRKPTRLAPGVPPVADTLPGFELLGWYGVLVPKRTPEAIVAKVHAELVKALGDSHIQEQLVKMGAEAGVSSPAEFSAFLKKETQRWDKLLREGGTIKGS
jgi:tripartite-type tricarboxylate transporter receptor subunit TctC